MKKQSVGAAILVLGLIVLGIGIYDLTVVNDTTTAYAVLIVGMICLLGGLAALAAFAPVSKVSFSGVIALQLLVLWLSISGLVALQAPLRTYFVVSTGVVCLLVVGSGAGFLVARWHRQRGVYVGMIALGTFIGSIGVTCVVLFGASARIDEIVGTGIACVVGSVISRSLFRLQKLTKVS